MKRLICLIAVAGLLIGAGCQRIQQSGDAFATPTVGSRAVFQPYARWQVSGTVTVIDDHTLHFDDFTFQADKLPAKLALMKDNHIVGQLEDLNGQHVRDVSFDEPLPSGVTLQDFNLVTVISPDMGVSVSGAAFTQ